MYTLPYLKWKTNKDLLYSTGNSAPCYVAAQIGVGLGENVYVWLSPLVGHLKLSKCCYSAIPWYKIKSSKEKKKVAEKEMKSVSYLPKYFVCYLQRIWFRLVYFYNLQTIYLKGKPLFKAIFIIQFLLLPAYFFFFNYWSIANLQCYSSFQCTEFILDFYTSPGGREYSSEHISAV